MGKKVLELERGILSCPTGTPQKKRQGRSLSQLSQPSPTHIFDF